MKRLFNLTHDEMYQLKAALCGVIERFSDNPKLDKYMGVKREDFLKLSQKINAAPHYENIIVHAKVPEEG